MPALKSIAVIPTKRGGWRKEPSPTVSGAEDEAAPPHGSARPARRVALQPTHRYRVGDRLHMIGGGQSVQRAASGCKVLSLLPYEGYGALLYRVRSDSEACERIVAEADLGR